MIEKMQGPEKGLIDVLFGNKAESAQAGEPTTDSGDAVQQVTEDFSKSLANAQDQKDAQTAQKGGVQIKGGIKQDKNDTSGVTDAKAKAALNAAAAKQKVTSDENKSEKIQAIKAKAKAEIKAEAKPDVKSDKKSEVKFGTKSEMSGEALAQAQLLAQIGAQGAVGPAMPQQKTQAQLQKLQSPVAVIEAQKQSQMQAGSAEIQQAVLAAERAAVTAQQSAVAAQQAALNVEFTAHRQMTPGQNTLQPIVIQMPAVGIPVQILEVDAEDGDRLMTELKAGVSQPKANAMSSQEFLAGRSILGVDRVDPRLGGRFNSDERSSSDSRSSSTDVKTSMLIPQVGGQHGNIQTSTVVPGAEVGVVRTPGGMTEITNTAMLASQVRGLASQGGGAIKMRVMPESLGEITIHVQSVGHKLNVRFEAESSLAREALNNAMPELRTMLTASQFDVNSLTVDQSAAAPSFTQIVRLGDILSQVGDLPNWNRQGGQSGDQQNGSAWDRYFDQRDGQSQSNWQGGRNGYRRYQQSQELGA